MPTKSLMVFPKLTNLQAAIIMERDAFRSDQEATQLEAQRDSANKHGPTLTGRDLHEHAMYLRGHATHYRKEAGALRFHPNTKREPWTA